MWTGMNQRKFPRANYQCKVSLKKKANQKTSQVSAVTENIGIGGVCVILDKKLDLFSEVDLELTLAEHKKPIQCTGKIVWVVREASYKDSSDDKYDTGIEFVDISDEDKTVVEGIINQIVDSNANT